jgi:CRP/FNR family transcriptional regulator, anaerobic regulatory protein
MQTKFTKPELPRTLHKYFPDLELALSEEMAAVGEIMELREGQPLMRARQPFRHMIFVLEGNVKIFREGDDGGEFYLYSLTSGDACALSLSCTDHFEQSLLKGVTLEDGVALLIPIEYMDKWLVKYKTWGRLVLNSIRERMEELLTTFDQVAFRNLDERLEFYLKRQRKNMDSDVLPFSHAQIATDLNTSREVVSRLLKKMEQRGLIQLNRNEIVLTGL